MAFWDKRELDKAGNNLLSSLCLPVQWGVAYTHTHTHRIPGKRRKMTSLLYNKVSHCSLFSFQLQTQAAPSQMPLHQKKPLCQNLELKSRPAARGVVGGGGGCSLLSMARCVLCETDLVAKFAPLKRAHIAQNWYSVACENRHSHSLWQSVGRACMVLYLRKNRSTAMWLHYKDCVFSTTCCLPGGTAAEIQIWAQNSAV